MKEAILSDIPPIVLDKMAEIKKMEATLKKLKKEIADHLEPIAEMMTELDVEELETKWVTITNSKPYSYDRVKGLKEILKVLPDFAMDYPALVGQTNVKGHIKIKLKE